MPERRAKNEPTVSSPFPDIREKFAPAWSNHQKTSYINRLNEIHLIGGSGIRCSEQALAAEFGGAFSANAVSIFVIDKLACFKCGCKPRRHAASQ
jgi:hypothetical protein